MNLSQSIFDSSFLDSSNTHKIESGSEISQNASLPQTKHQHLDLPTHCSPISLNSLSDVIRQQRDAGHWYTSIGQDVLLCCPLASGKGSEGVLGLRDTGSEATTIQNNWAESALLDFTEFIWKHIERDRQTQVVILK